MFDIRLSIDNNPKLSITYIKNFPTVEHINKDITTFLEREILELKNKYNFDIIIGGPPCQGFSLAGKIGRMEKDDERNSLFYRM